MGNTSSALRRAGRGVSMKVGEGQQGPFASTAPKDLVHIARRVSCSGRRAKRSLGVPQSSDLWGKY